MTKKRRAARSSTGRSVSARPTGGGGSAPWLVVVAILVAVGGVLGYVQWKKRAPHDVGVSLGAATTTEILQRTREAEQRGDYDTAFALYRAGLARSPNDVYLVGSYGAATTNASYAVRRNRGRLVPVMPTSLDRVRAAQEALALFDRAQAAAPAMPAPAYQKGLMYAAWGLPEDALVELYAAVLKGDRSPEIDRVAGAITLLQLGRGSELEPGQGPAPDQNGRPASR